MKYIAGYVWCTLLVCAAMADDPNCADGAFVPGRQVRIEAESKDVSGGCFMVYVPSDYEPRQNWPVIFYYRGAGEPLSTERFQTATGSKGYIIAAMEFQDIPKSAVTQSQYLAYLHRELRSIAAVRTHLSKHLKIDSQKLLLAGVSKGGWLVSDLVDLSTSPWAGIAIFCAGRHRIVSSAAPTGISGKPVYIGAGRTDPNLDAAKNAAEQYRRRGAKVTMDIYPELGHAVDPNSPALRQWLNDIGREQKEKISQKHDPNTSSGAPVSKEPPLDKSGSR